MASSYTSNYGLCQWAAEDKVLRTEFNADNQKIDAAITAVDSRVDGKASTSELNSLKSTVSSLSQTVAGHTASLSGKGNCQVYSTTYTGSGGSGAASPNALTFPQQPMMVFITGPNGIQGIFNRGQTVHCTGRFSMGGNYVTLTWSGNTLRWYSDSGASTQLNSSGETYFVIALLNAG